MSWIGALQSNMGDALVAAARSTQALVIETLDRTAGGNKHNTVPLLNRVVGLQLEFVSLMLDDPARIVDDGYEVLRRLTSLHREFAQRLFDVVDPRDIPVEVTSAPGSGRVLPFPAKRASKS